MEKIYKYAKTFNQDGTLVVNLYNDDSYKQHETGSYYLYENVKIKETKGILEIEFEKCLEIKKCYNFIGNLSEIGSKEVNLEYIVNNNYYLINFWSILIHINLF